MLRTVGCYRGGIVVVWSVQAVPLVLQDADVVYYFLFLSGILSDKNFFIVQSPNLRSVLLSYFIYSP